MCSYTLYICVTVCCVFNQMDGDMFHDDDHRMDTLTDIQSQVKTAFDAEDALIISTFSTRCFNINSSLQSCLTIHI
jgi:hypothetical protein